LNDEDELLAELKLNPDLNCEDELLAALNSN